MNAKKKKSNKHVLHVLHVLSQMANLEKKINTVSIQLAT